MTIKEFKAATKGLPSDLPICINGFHDILFAGLCRMKVNGKLTAAFVVSDDLDNCMDRVQIPRLEL